MRRFCVPSLVLVVIAIAASLPPSARASEMLANAGFEEGTVGWASLDAALYTSDAARSGQRALAMTSPGFEQAFDVFQAQTVHPGWEYELSAWVTANDPNIQRAFLRVSWLDSGNSLVSITDSGWLTGASASYRGLSTGPRTAPSGVAVARVAIYVIASGPFTALADDASFVVTSIPSPLSSSPATPSPGVTPSPNVTPGATSSAPTAPPTPSATVTPVGEPSAFDLLTNGSFEVVREDGTAYGWRNIGGVDRVIDGIAVKGSRSLEISSSTSSTKWAYQTVRVQAGSWYRATAWARASQTEAFLRLSWYASLDGSGRIIESRDSKLHVVQDEFSPLVTDAVQAPGGARAVKVRLMLRPSVEGQGSATFDDVKFTPSGPEMDEPEGSVSDESDADSPARPQGGAQVRAVSDAGAEPAQAGRILKPLVNAPRNGVAPESAPIVHSTGSPARVALLVLVFGSLSVIAAFMAREVARPDRD